MERVKCRRKLIISVIVLVLVTSGLPAQTVEPVSSDEHFGQKPQLDQSVKTIQLVVRVSPNLPRYFPFALGGDVHWTLQSAGFAVVGEDSTNYDAKLILNANGSAIQSLYTDGETHYSGASVRGSLAFLVDGEEILSYNFVGTRIPYDGIGASSFKRPEDAPFENAYEEAKLEQQVFSALLDLGRFDISSSLISSLESLVDTDGSKSISRCAALAWALEQICDPQAIPALVKLSEKYKRTNFAGINASEALGRMAQSEINAYYARRKERRIKLAIQASMAISAILGASALFIYLYFAVQRLVFRHSIGGQTTVKSLIYALENNKRTWVRAQAAERLGKMKDHTSVPVLAGILAEDSSRLPVRYAVTKALGRIGDPAAVPTLAESLENED